VAELEAAAREATAMTRGLRQRAERTMQNVANVTADLARATPPLPAIARNVEASSANMPQVLLQAQQTALELERLLAQLRGHWLLGGDGADPAAGASRRQPASQVRP
jgi:phospholipid/cholesterol/gamma-HCH transport system substrate-binding protein